MGVARVIAYEIGDWRISHYCRGNARLFLQGLWRRGDEQLYLGLATHARTCMQDAVKGKERKVVRLIAFVIRQQYAIIRRGML